VSQEVFIPIDKFGPLAVNKASHRALLPAANKCVQLVSNLTRADISDDERVRVLVQLRKLFSDIKITLEEHARYEDEVIFPNFNFLFPGASEQVGGPCTLLLCRAVQLLVFA
jgi:iron-sulfur cluster repair protein YtfE (RIC family)